MNKKKYVLLIRDARGKGWRKASGYRPDIEMGVRGTFVQVEEDRRGAEARGNFQINRLVPLGTISGRESRINELGDAYASREE